MNTYIISEIGINHNGDLDIAKRLINISSFAGVDCVKFQKRNPDVCVPEDQKNIERITPWGKMSYIDYRKKIEFGKKEYDAISLYCSHLELDWTASVWDLSSLYFISEYEVPFIKVPSAKITDRELLRSCREVAIEKNIGVIISTGMSTLEEIDGAVADLKGCRYSLLHCNSTYPSRVDDLNLSCIMSLKERYMCPIGYSGHEFRTGTTAASIYLGATILERHVTLDRTMWGTDQMSSLEPEGLITFVRAVRDLERAFGNGQKTVSDEELKIKEKLRK